MKNVTCNQPYTYDEFLAAHAANLFKMFESDPQIMAVFHRMKNK